MNQSELQIIQQAAAILDRLTEPGNAHPDQSFQNAIASADEELSFLLMKVEQNPSLIEND